MSLVFKPNGTLDVATSPADLPEKDGYSDAMQRCKNLRLDRVGFAALRDGSTRLNSTALSGARNWLLVENGVRYSQFGTVIYRDEVSIQTGVANAQASGVRYKSFNESTRNVFYTNGTDRYRIAGSTVRQWGIDAPTADPTAAVSGTTGLEGTYGYKYTYARQDGSTVISESNPSDAVSIDANLETVTVSWTASSDAQVTHVRVYRTLKDGSIYYFLTSVAIGTTSYADTTADGDLGAEVEIDHDRPPAGTILVGPVYNGLLFMAAGNELYWCKNQQPDYWPTANNIELAGPDEPITALTVFDGQVYVFSKYRAWYIQGTGTGVFHPIPLQTSAGSQTLHGALPVVGKGIFHTGPDGIYAFTGGSDSKWTERLLDPVFKGYATNGVPAVTTMNNTWLLKFENKLWFHYGDGSVFVLNLDTNRLTYHKYDESMLQPCIDEVNNYLLCLDESGYVRWLENKSSSTDAGTAIDWEVQSKNFTLQTRAHFPRWVKYDVDARSVITTDVKAEIILDGDVHQTHTIVDSDGTQVSSYDRNLRRRLIQIGNGERCSIKLSGTGPTTFYAAEME